MDTTQHTIPPPEKKSSDKGSILAGSILVVIGLLFLADNFIPGFRFVDFWPLILIAIGVGLLWKSVKTS